MKNGLVTSENLKSLKLVIDSINKSHSTANLKLNNNVFLMSDGIYMNKDKFWKLSELSNQTRDTQIENLLNKVSCIKEF